MSDPRRWRDEPSGATATDVLLRGARRPQPPDAYELQRLGAAVEAMAHAPIARPPSWVRLGLAGALAFLIVGGGTFVWALHARDEQQRAEATARERIARERTERTVAGAPTAPPAPHPEPRPAAASRPSRRHVAEVRVAAAPPPVEAVKPTDSLAREVPLIDEGRSQLGTAPSRALAALEAHRREFPHGQLAAEREFLAVQALLQMNHTADAKTRAAELATHYPTSSYAARAARLIEDAEAQRTVVPARDGSRGSARPGLRSDQDRL